MLPHTLPKDFNDAISTNNSILKMWQNITPLAKNEWICWVISAKKNETRKRRIDVGIDKLKKGMKRPCCWGGCPHRT